MKVVFLTTPELLEQHWPAAAMLLGEHVAELANGDFTVADLREMVDQRRAFAGMAFDAAGPALVMVIEFRHYPRKTVLNVMALAGHGLADVAVTFWPEFTRWAKEYGVSQIQACAAPAMTRVLRGLGFGHVYNLLRCEV